MTMINREWEDWAGCAGLWGGGTTPIKLPTFDMYSAVWIRDHLIEGTGGSTSEHGINWTRIRIGRGAGIRFHDWVPSR
jgi:hypothetical protein